MFRPFKQIQMATFIDRPNRFVVNCRIDGKKERVHLPNPGKLRELLLPESTLYLSEATQATGRKTRYTAVAVERDGRPVFLHTHLTNQVARLLIEAGRVPGLEAYRVIRPEVTVGHSRFDFLLGDGSHDFLLEVKSCTLFGKKIAMFPDAITARGRRHLEMLAESGRDGLRGGVLFVIHSPRARFFMPEYHTDFQFATTLLTLKDELFVRAVGVEWNKELVLGRKVRDLEIPWPLIEQESRDRGSYIIILKLARTRRLKIGALGDVLFPKGYYLYVGSAMKNLDKRVRRHQQRRKNLFWHIDYLRESAEFCAVLPVRASVSLECPMAAAVRKISDWTIPDFGASDCRCGSHLFGMAGDPRQSPGFIDLIQYYRIDRLEEGLGGYST